MEILKGVSLFLLGAVVSLWLLFDLTLWSRVNTIEKAHNALVTFTHGIQREVQAINPPPKISASEIQKKRDEIKEGEKS